MESIGDIFGGLMVILFILGFFLAVLWFILPFVIFAIKGKLDSAHLLLESIDRRLAEIEKGMRPAVQPSGESAAHGEETVNPVT